MVTPSTTPLLAAAASETQCSSLEMIPLDLDLNEALQTLQLPQGIPLGPPAGADGEISLSILDI